MIPSTLSHFLGKSLSMDLGTANSLIYVPKHGIVLNEPSVVAVDEEDKKILAVGQKAKRFVGRTPKRIKLIRPMKDGVIADFDGAKQMISTFIRMAMSGPQIFKPRIVIGVPTGITEIEKKAVLDSAVQVGVREVFLVEESMCAAIGAGLPIEEPQGNIVVDIGGGTSDVAVISMSSTVCGESARVAGDAMNEAIIDYFKNQFKLLIGENIAEQIKINIGSAYPLNDPLSMEVSGRSISTGMPCSVQVTDSQIREAISKPLREIIAAVKRTIEKTPPKLIEDCDERGILLAGGGALLRNVDKLISEEINLPVNIDPDPLTTCVRGAGKILDNRRYYKNLFIPT